MSTNPWYTAHTLLLGGEATTERCVDRICQIENSATLPPGSMVSDGRYHDMLRLIQARMTSPERAEKERALYRVRWGTGDRLNVRAHPELERAIERLALPGESVGDALKRIVCEAVRTRG